MKPQNVGNVTLPNALKIPRNAHQIQVKDRFILETLRSTGYDVYSAIYELIDNSIDAGSTQIKIDYNSEKLSLIISDNGCGMSEEKLTASMDIGCDREYSSNDIGYFGVGMKTSCLNLLDFEKADNLIEIETEDDTSNTIVNWEPRNTPLSFDKFSRKLSNKKGTIVSIKGVQKFSLQVLKKNIGVIFYPVLKNNFTKILVDGVEIKPSDPLYRDSELTKTNFVNATVRDIEIEICCCLIDDSQEKHSWDHNKLEGKWTHAKGGIYFIYGGRYIEYGGTFGLKNSDPWDSRTRIELTIPKNLTQVFGIKFNKTNNLKLDGNDNIYDVRRKLLDMFNWARNTRKKLGESISSKDEKDQMELFEKELNRSAVKAGVKPPKKDSSLITENIHPKTKKFTNDIIDPNINKKHRPATSATIIEKKLFDIRTENMGATNCFWHLGFENNVFIITLNEAHLFYRDIYKNMNDSGRKDMIFLLASMAYAQYETSLAPLESNHDFFWEEYWSQVSLRLKHLISN